MNKKLAMVGVTRRHRMDVAIIFLLSVLALLATIAFTGCQSDSPSASPTVGSLSRNNRKTRDAAYAEVARLMLRPRPGNSFFGVHRRDDGVRVTVYGDCGVSEIDAWYDTNSRWRVVVSECGQHSVVDAWWLEEHGELVREVAVAVAGVCGSKVEYER